MCSFYVIQEIRKLEQKLCNRNSFKIGFTIPKISSSKHIRSWTYLEPLKTGHLCQNLTLSRKNRDKISLSVKNQNSKRIKQNSRADHVKQLFRLVSTISRINTTHISVVSNFNMKFKLLKQVKDHILLFSLPQLNLVNLLRFVLSQH